MWTKLQQSTFDNISLSWAILNANTAIYYTVYYKLSFKTDTFLGVCSRLAYITEMLRHRLTLMKEL